jgi:hypothetical protein
VKVIGNMLEIDTKLRNHDSSLKNGQYLFGAKRQMDKLTLTFADGTDFGVLNDHTAATLSKVLDQHKAEIECLAFILLVRETIERAAKANDAVVRVDINLYGEIGAKDEVGCCLWENKLYLQRPTELREGLKYENPHVIQFPDLPPETSELIPELSGEKTDTLKSPETFRWTIFEVYASLKRGDGLERMEGDDRVKTDLLL